MSAAAAATSLAGALNAKERLVLACIEDERSIRATKLFALLVGTFEVAGKEITLTEADLKACFRSLSDAGLIEAVGRGGEILTSTDDGDEAAKDLDAEREALDEGDDEAEAEADEDSDAEAEAGNDNQDGDEESDDSTEEADDDELPSVPPPAPRPAPRAVPAGRPGPQAAPPPRAPVAPARTETNSARATGGRAGLDLLDLPPAQAQQRLAQLTHAIGLKAQLDAVMAQLRGDEPAETPAPLANPKSPRPRGADKVASIGKDGRARDERGYPIKGALKPGGLADRIVALLSAHGPMKVAAVSTALGGITVSSTVSRLVKFGRLRRSGSRLDCTVELVSLQCTAGSKAPSSSTSSCSTRGATRTASPADRTGPHAPAGQRSPLTSAAAKPSIAAGAARTTPGI